MARVIVTNIASGDVPDHLLIREPYEDGATDVGEWLRGVVERWRALPDGPHVLRAVVLRFTARPTAAVLDIRDAMGRRAQGELARLVLVVPSAQLAWTETAVAARPHPVRTGAVTPATLLAWIDAHPWPIPLDPALGGEGVRHGRGRHGAWGHVDPAPVDLTGLPDPAIGAPTTGLD